MTKLNFYELSLEADHDLDEILDYSIERHGFDQAISYLEDFEILFQRLVLNPELGKSRKDIREHLRSFPKGEHVVFYRIMKNSIRIVRVLHGSRDLGKNF